MTSEYGLFFYPYFDLTILILTKICVSIKGASNTLEVGNSTCRAINWGNLHLRYLDHISVQF